MGAKEEEAVDNKDKLTGRKLSKEFGVVYHGIVGFKRGWLPGGASGAN